MGCQAVSPNSTHTFQPHCFNPNRVFSEKERMETIGDHACYDPNKVSVDTALLPDGWSSIVCIPWRLALLCWIGLGENSRHWFALERCIKWKFPTLHCWCVRTVMIWIFSDKRRILDKTAFAFFLRTRFSMCKPLAFKPPTINALCVSLQTAFSGNDVQEKAICARCWKMFTAIHGLDRAWAHELHAIRHVIKGYDMHSLGASDDEKVSTSAEGMA